MRKATICVGGILCLGLAALAGVHMYESVATTHADAATTTVPRTVNATVTSVNETRHAPHPLERATGARLGKTCGIDGDDDDGDDDATLVRARPGGK